MPSTSELASASATSRGRDPPKTLVAPPRTKTALVSPMGSGAIGNPRAANPAPSNLAPANQAPSNAASRIPMRTGRGVGVGYDSNPNQRDFGEDDDIPATLL